MGLQNVEKIAVQENHEKTWFNRFKTKIGVATALASTSIMSSIHAAPILTPADVTSATDAAGGEAVLSTTGIWVITIVVSMVIVGLVVALIKKK